MLSKVQTALARLLSSGEPLLAGVSGGADSVALLDVLAAGRWRPHVCHLNHKLRGAESDADAEFVRELAVQYGLPATIEWREVGSNEDAARQARFDFFQSVAARTGIKKLVLAHTADDQVETFLLRLLRGSGVSGLIGIWPERRIGELVVVRPLLRVTRPEVLQYLNARGLKWREDATNTDTRFTRNRIRHELLPLLEREFNPAIRETLLRTAEILRDEDELLSQLADAARFEDLWTQPAAVQRRLLRQWLGEDLDFDHIEAVRLLRPGTEATLPNGLVVCREYDTLRKVMAQPPLKGRWLLNLNGETEIPELGISLVCRAERSEGSLPGTTELLRIAQNDNRGEEHFDADALGNEPFLRTWESGDRFQPLGMNESKKLQDFFVDEKVPRHQRGRVPVLCAADGRIAWVVGHRLAEPFKVTAQTRRVFRVSFKG